MWLWQVSGCTGKVAAGCGGDTKDIDGRCASLCNNDTHCPDGEICDGGYCTPGERPEGERVLPTVELVEPAGVGVGLGTTSLRVRFSKTMDVTSGLASLVVHVGSPSGAELTIEKQRWSEDGRELLADIISPLEAYTLYLGVVRGGSAQAPRDILGQALAEDHEFLFRSESVTSPESTDADLGNPEAGETSDLTLTFEAGGGIASGDEVVITFPPGVDASQVDLAGTDFEIVSADGNTLTLGALTPYAPGTTVIIVLTGVPMPAAPGSYVIQLSTTADAVPAQVPFEVIEPGTQVSGLTVAADDITCDEVATYTLDFSATSGIDIGDQVLVTFPPGTNLSGVATEGAFTIGGTSGTTVILTAGTSFADGAPVHVVLRGVRNPASLTGGSFPVVLETSNDVVEAIGNVTLEPGTQVGGLSVTVGNPAAQASSTYTVAFDTTSPIAVGDTVAIVFPPGTILSGVALFGGDFTLAVSGSTVLLTATAEVAAAQPVSIKLIGVINPPLAGAVAADFTIRVETTQDHKEAVDLVTIAPPPDCGTGSPGIFALDDVGFVVAGEAFIELTGTCSAGIACIESSHGSVTNDCAGSGTFTVDLVGAGAGSLVDLVVTASTDDQSATAELDVLDCRGGPPEMEVADNFPAGNGTSPEFAYEIHTLGQLLLLHDHLAAGTYFELKQDIEIPACAEWTPIGAGASFDGVLDGEGHTISGLFFDDPAYTAGAGLFATVSGSIANLELEGFHIRAAGTAGTLAGIASANLSGVTVSDAMVFGAGSYVGGLAGFAGWSSPTVRDVSVEATVVGDGPYVGGLYGWARYSTMSSVSFSGSVSGGAEMTGGIVGSSDGGSFAAVYVAGQVSGTTQVGGIAGTFSDNVTIFESAVVADVSGTDGVGGLLGDGEFAAIARSYVSGSVDGGTDVGPIFGAGIVGTYQTLYLDDACATPCEGSSQGVGVDALTLSTQGSLEARGFDFDVARGAWLPPAGAPPLPRDPCPDGYTLIDTPVPSPGLYDGGDGTPGNPFVIRGEAAPAVVQLAGMGYYVPPLPGPEVNYRNRSYLLDTDVTFDACTSWRPVGDSQMKFTGSLIAYEQGVQEPTRTLTGLVIDGAAGDRDGFFGWLDHAVVRGITFDRPRVFADNVAGVLAGALDYSNLDRIKVTGGIVVGQDDTGGIVGGAGQGYNNTLNRLELEDSLVAGEGSTGGILGYAYWYNQKPFWIGNCKVSGLVTSNATVGGAVGYLASSLVYCHSTATVVGTYEVGGLVGYSEDAGMSFVSATGDVFGGDNVGGLAGTSQYTAIHHAWSNNTVHAGRRIGWGYYVGGLVGDGSSGLHIWDSYSRSDIVEASELVGGLVGILYGVVTRSYATGDIDADGTDVDRVVGIAEAVGSRDTTFGLSTAACGGTPCAPCEPAGSCDFEPQYETASVLQDPTTFTNGGWDFGTTATEHWATGEDGYPILVTECPEGRLNLLEPADDYEAVVAGPTYQIATREQLALMAADIAEEINEGARFELLADIDLDRCTAWLPIGAGDNYRFRGELVGNGHTISNVRVRHPAGYGVGLFGEIDDPADIHDLVLTGVDVQGAYNVGTLVGYAWSSGTETIDFTNIAVSGVVRAWDDYSGGFVGKLMGGTNTVTHITTDVRLESNASYVGGVFGSVDGTTATELFATGDVLGLPGNSGVEGYYFGGVIGQVYNSGYGVTPTVVTELGFTGGIWGHSYVGGVVGQSSGATIGDCFSTAQVIAGPEATGVGGILGVMSSGIVERCHTAGGVTAGPWEWYTPQTIDRMIGERSGGTVTALYYLSSGSCPGSPCDDSHGGDPLIADAMDDTASFVGWDFADEWEMGADYPVLTFP